LLIEAETIAVAVDVAVADVAAVDVAVADGVAVVVVATTTI
jgi:hypothetical protein